MIRTLSESTPHQVKDRKGKEEKEENQRFCPTFLCKATLQVRERTSRKARAPNFCVLWGMLLLFPSPPSRIFFSFASPSLPPSFPSPPLHPSRQHGLRHLLHVKESRGSLPFFHNSLPIPSPSLVFSSPFLSPSPSPLPLPPSPLPPSLPHFYFSGGLMVRDWVRTRRA